MQHSCPDISKVNKFIGIGTTIHKFIDIIECFVYLSEVTYHLQPSKVCLSVLIPQVLYQSCSRKSNIYGDSVQILLPNWNYIDVHIDFFYSNIPIVWNSRCTESEKKKSGISLGGKVNLAGNHHFSDPSLTNLLKSKNHLTITFPLSRPQKLLLLFHWKLGTSMYCIQEHMWPIEAEESSGVFHDMPFVIIPVFKSTPNLKTPPPCQSFQIAHSKQYAPQIKQTTKAFHDQKGALSQNA